MLSEDKYYIYQDFVSLIAFSFEWVRVARNWLIPTWVIPLDCSRVGPLKVSKLNKMDPLLEVKIFDSPQG